MELVSTVASWFTPTTLFLLLNLMVGTIVITSRFGSGSRKHQPHHDGFGSDHAPAPLTRATSIIDRVKSINFHLYKFPHPETELFSTSSHHDIIGSDLHVNPDPNPSPLPRSPSLLDRVKSINMLYFKFPHDATGSDSDTHSHLVPNSNTAPLQRAPSLLDRVKSINMSYFKFQQYNSEDHFDHTEPTRFENIPTRKSGVVPIDISKFKIPEEDQPTGPGFDNPINPPGLTRAPSILQRVKSITLSSFYRSDPDTHADQIPDPNSELYEEDHKHVRSKSESKKPVKKKKKATGKMTKSASEKSAFGFIGSQEAAETVESIEQRRPETTRVERSTSFGDGEDGVDAKASDFINKFKQQLKLQRLDSILRYKEMLKSK